MLDRVAGVVPLLYLVFRLSSRKTTGMGITLKDYWRGAFAVGGASSPEKDYFRFLYGIGKMDKWLRRSLIFCASCGALLCALLFLYIIAYTAKPIYFPINRFFLWGFAATSMVLFTVPYVYLGVSWWSRFGGWLKKSDKELALIRFFGSKQQALDWCLGNGQAPDVSPVLFPEQELAWLGLLKIYIPWFATLVLAALYGTTSGGGLAEAVVSILGLLALVQATIPVISRFLPWDGVTSMDLHFQTAVVQSDIQEVFGTF
jgi:hypothetical protein